MATDQSYARFYNKKLLPLDQLDTNFLQYLRGIVDDAVIMGATSLSGVDQGIVTRLSIPVTATGNNQVNVGAAGGPFKAHNGSGKLVKFAAADARCQGIKIPVNAAVIYDVALESALVEDKTEVNPRTGLIEYRNIKESIGRITTPSVVTWTVGTTTLRLELDAALEAGFDSSGRTVRVWLKPIASGGSLGPQVAVDGPAANAAFYTGTTLWDGTKNYINIVHATPLGMAVPSTTAADYVVQVQGPTVRRHALEDLTVTVGAIPLASVTSVAAGNPIVTISQVIQRFGPLANWAAATGSNLQGVSGTGDGTGPGVFGTGGGASGPGLSGTGGTPNGIGVTGQGVGSGAGIKGIGGTTFSTNAAGVWGIGGATGGSPGVRGDGTVGQPGGLFTGNGAGAGVYATGGASGPGLSGTGGAGQAGVYGSGNGAGEGGVFAPATGAAMRLLTNGVAPVGLSGLGGSFWIEQDIQANGVWIFKTQTVNATPSLATWLIPLRSRLVLTYSANMAPDFSTGTEHVITATNGTAFTITNANAVNLCIVGQRYTFRIRNTSGGALGAVTWGTVYKMAAWVSPATGFSRSIEFQSDGVNLIEVSRTTADVPN